MIRVDWTWKQTNTALVVMDIRMLQNNCEYHETVMNITKTAVNKK